MMISGCGSTTNEGSTMNDLEEYLDSEPTFEDTAITYDEDRDTLKVAGVRFRIENASDAKKYNIVIGIAPTAVWPSVNDGELAVFTDRLTGTIYARVGIVIFAQTGLAVEPASADVLNAGFFYLGAAEFATETTIERTGNGRHCTLEIRGGVEPDSFNPSEPFNVLTAILLVSSTDRTHASFGIVARGLVREELDVTSLMNDLLAQACGEGP
jgi:hypothetical protein